MLRKISRSPRPGCIFSGCFLRAKEEKSSAVLTEAPFGGRLAALSAGGLFGGCLAEKKRCLQRLCGDLERKVGWKFSGNGGRRDFVDFRRVFG